MYQNCDGTVLHGFKDEMTFETFTVQMYNVLYSQIRMTQKTSKTLAPSWSPIGAPVLIFPEEILLIREVISC
jgi:hypothetical protein